MMGFFHKSMLFAGRKLSLNGQLGKYLRLRLLGIDVQETTFTKRRFSSNDAEKQQRLESIGAQFLFGYHCALAAENLQILVTELNTVNSEMRGFAFEGAAMSLALLDYFSLGQGNRLKTLLAGAGADHIYMMYVGMGWLLARIPWGIERYLAQLNQKSKIKKTIPDPVLGWLAVDGYGFHQGYFHHQRYVKLQFIPQGISDYALRVFDQGLGRSLWFVNGADINLISTTIASFHPDRQADLWSGIGLASAYAGGVNRQELEALRISAGCYSSHLAQGAAFAAKARQRADILGIHTEMASEVLCGMSAQSAAEITDIAIQDLPNDSILPAYEIWRQRIQNQFVTFGVKV